MVGGCFIYFGGNSNIDSIYKYKLEGETKWGEFSKIMTHADINGDGYDELFIFAPGFPDINFPQGKLYIYSYKEFTDVKDYKGNIPGTFKLYQNYPNPFNPATTITYSVAQTAFVTLKIYDALGKEIAALVNEEKTAGIYKISFNADKYASGVYFYQLKADGILLTNKMILLR